MSEEKHSHQYLTMSEEEYSHQCFLGKTSVTTAVVLQVASEQRLR